MFLSNFMMSRSVFSHISRIPMKQVNLIMRAPKNTKSIHSFIYEPRGVNQINYVNHLNNPNVPLILGIGPTGTGKTLFACTTAVKELQNGTVDKIVLTSPVVPAEEYVGHLPGSLFHELNPWTRPIFYILEEYYSLREIDSMIHSGTIEFSPLTFMRGRTFKNSFIIADEMQNSSPDQICMLVTRLGQGSRMVITGDLKQSDRPDDNGLLDLLHKIKHHNRVVPDIKTIHFSLCDVERSHIVSRVLRLYSDNVKPNIMDNDSIKHSEYSVFSKNYTQKND